MLALLYHSCTIYAPTCSSPSEFNSFWFSFFFSSMARSYSDMSSSLLSDIELGEPTKIYKVSYIL